MEYRRKPMSRTLRFTIMRRDHFTCQYCGSRAPDVALEVDHISSVADGGENDPSNLITACFDCNRGKRHRSLHAHEYERGFLELADSLISEAEFVDIACDDLPLWGEL